MNWLAYGFPASMLPFCPAGTFHGLVLENARNGAASALEPMQLHTTSVAARAPSALRDRLAHRLWPRYFPASWVVDIAPSLALPLPRHLSGATELAIGTLDRGRRRL